MPPFVPLSAARIDQAMCEALAIGQRAADHGEVPVGAVLLFEDAIVARAGNLRERTNDPLGHAELLCIAEAARALRRWRLFGTTLVVTLEPCAMCAGAVVNSRIDHVVFGARDPKAGAAGSVLDVFSEARLNHRPRVTGGVMAAESASLLRAFFQKRRRHPA